MTPGNEPRDEQFDAMLREGFRAAGVRRGVCPEPETLTRLRLGELPSEAAEAVRAHVARCGVCDTVLGRMEGFRFRPARESWWRAIGWKPALGYALAVLLAYPAYVGLRPPSAESPKVVAPALEAPPGISLDVSRAPGEARLTAQGEHFFVLFFLPGDPGQGYRARILTADGRPIGTEMTLRSWDGQGNYLLLCRSEAFPPGRYVVELAGPGRTVQLPFNR